MSADDLGILSEALQSRARVDADCEVLWHVRDALGVLSELAEAGRVVLGLDIRDYDDDGNLVEVAWSLYAGSDPAEARELAIEALARDGLPGDWALITWRPSVADSAADGAVLAMSEQVRRFTLWRRSSFRVRWPRR